MRRPLLYPLLALIAGIWTGDHILFHYSGLACVSLAILMTLFLSVRKKWANAAFALILSFIFVIGLFSISRYQYLRSDVHHVMHFLSHDKLTIEGVVISSEQISPDKSLMLVECVRRISRQTYSKLTGRIRLIVPSEINFDCGDFIRFRTSVKPIAGFHNPGGFDYQRYLNRQSIFVSGFISGAQDIILIRRHWKSSLPYAVDHFRQYLNRLIYAHAQTPEREILEAMTTGNQKAIPADIRDAFSQTGTSHILSISGLHVGLVASAGFFLILWLLKSSEYLMLRFNIIKVAAAASLIPVAVYALIAGMGTPVLRSAFMALSFLIALIIGKLRDLYNVLFGVALIILMILPESLFEISFQLSFSAVFALIYIVPRFSNPVLSFLTSTPHWFQFGFRQIYLFIVVSVAATIGTLPIIIYYFNRLSTITILANLLAVPLLGMLTLLFILLFILTAVFSASAAGWVIKGASFFTSISIEIIKRLASLPWSSLSFIKPNGMEIILLYIILFGLIEILTPSDHKTDRRFAARHPLLIKIAVCAAIALLTVSGVYLDWKDKTSSDLKLTALDVGQGSSTLIEFPGGTRMLIDGGGFSDSSFDMGKSVVAPFLYSKRIRKIDIVVLTHPHPDHMQGLIYILNNFDVREVWTTDVKSDDDLYLLWEKTLSERKIKVRPITSRTPPVVLTTARIDYLWPDDLSVNSGIFDTNDQSLVLRITFGENRLLITGDISSRVESLLISSGNNLRSDVLLVPHHGSIHSSSAAFIQSVAPQYAIVSAGKNNAFRHPHPDVLNRYHANGVQIFRTDQHGSISVLSDGKKLEITPYHK